MILTRKEIIDLAEFVGLEIGESYKEDNDNNEDTEISIDICPKEGLIDDDGDTTHYKHIAYFAEYPEEGCIGLGYKICQTK